MNKIQLKYYRPKTFEFYREETIYNFFGIRFYKKYLPSTGDIMRRWRRIKQIEIGQTSKIGELYKYEKKTRNYEWRHLIGNLLFVLLIFIIDRKFTAFDWIFISILNLIVNIYPIFLQRYNRIRIIKILVNHGYKSPYEL